MRMPNPLLVLLVRSWRGLHGGPELQAARRSRFPDDFSRPEPLPAGQAASLADLKWFEVFKDDKLQELIRTALVKNYDLRDAVAARRRGRANLGITRSNQYPEFRRQRRRRHQSSLARRRNAAAAGLLALTESQFRIRRAGTAVV